MLCRLGTVAGLAALLAGACSAARPAADLAAVARELQEGGAGAACAALARAPSSPDDAGDHGWLEAARLRARCRAARGEAEAAVAAARARVAAQPEEAPAHMALALALVARGPAGLDEAVAAVGRAAALAPACADYPYLAGTLLLDDERAAAARPLLERAVALDGSWAAPRLALAQALADLDEAAAARAALGPVPELDPTAAEVARGRAVGARLTGLFRGVPPDTLAAYRRAAALMQQDLPGQAVGALEELTRVRPSFAAAHTLLGLAHLKLGNDARAFAALARAAELDPDDPTSQLYLGLLYRARDHGARAEEHLLRALALDPFNERATAALARQREEAKQPRAAAKLYRRLAALDGGRPATLRAWARALSDAGDRQHAEQVLLRALERQPSSYETNLALGEVYHARYVDSHDAEARRYAERARRHLRRALELHPGDAAARRLLQQLK